MKPLADDSSGTRAFVGYLAAGDRLHGLVMDDLPTSISSRLSGTRAAVLNDPEVARVIIKMLGGEIVGVDAASLEAAIVGRQFTRAWDVAATATAVTANKSAQNTPPAISDRIVIELARIEPGWAGRGSLPPSEELICSIEALLERAPANTVMPVIEVEEDGSAVALRWVMADNSRSFSLVFPGNGRVTGVLATLNPPQSRTWGAAIEDEAKIAAVFEEHAIRETITG
jgi:hypothetical protein